MRNSPIETKTLKSTYGRLGDGYSRLEKVPTLYVQGKEELLQDKFTRISVVGSKNCSLSSRKTAKTVAEHLSDAGVVVVSGLAYGIDATVHESVVQSGGYTIAVLGKKLTQVPHPLSLFPLHREIRRNHLMISQFKPSVNTGPWSFIARNYVMAAISDASCVIEADMTSETRILAQQTQKFGHPLYLSPKILDSGYDWVEDLAQNGAIPLLSAEQITQDLGI